VIRGPVGRHRIGRDAEQRENGHRERQRRGRNGDRRARHGGKDSAEEGADQESAVPDRTGDSVAGRKLLRGRRQRSEQSRLRRLVRGRQNRHGGSENEHQHEGRMHRDDRGQNRQQDRTAEADDEEHRPPRPPIGGQAGDRSQHG
jgi:hypothetical protein